jgi:hypothetical protein
MGNKNKKIKEAAALLTVIAVLLIWIICSFADRSIFHTLHFNCGDIVNCPCCLQNCDIEQWEYADGTLYIEDTWTTGAIYRTRACIIVEPNDQRDFRKLFGVGTKVCWKVRKKNKENQK